MNKFNLIALSALIVAGSTFTVPGVLKRSKNGQVVSNPVTTSTKKTNTKTNTKTNPIQPKGVLNQYKNGVKANKGVKASNSIFSARNALALTAVTTALYGTAEYFGYAPAIFGKIFNVARTNITMENAKNGFGILSTGTSIYNFASSLFSKGTQTVESNSVVPQPEKNNTINKIDGAYQG